jgi:RHS repeat-associated protein
MKTLLSIHKALLVSSIAALFLICAPEARPQAQNQYDKGTPPQFAAGVSSFGSYTSADIGTVNLSNGALNLKLPLGVVGGRGMSLPITLNWSSKIWSASIDYDAEHGPGRGGLDDPNPSMVPLAYAEYNAAENYASFNSRLEAGWTIGGMPFITQRVIRINYTDINPQGPCYHWTLPKISFTTPDGGEIEFRDDNYDGAPLPSSDCGGWTAIASRGHRWHATDGSGWIYINDSDNGAAGRFPDLTGVIISSEGTRFYIGGGGVCYLIKDRNGNQISVDSNGGIVDPLGRTTTIQQNVTDPETGEGLAVLVTMKGYGGGPRYYKVKSGTMNQHYRTGINPNLPVVTGSYDPMSWGYNAWWPTTATRLFPYSYGRFAQRVDYFPVIYELVLPDHRSMHFNYNEFGEVAEVQLPSGGKVWYDYGPANGLPAGNSAVFETAATYHTTVEEVDRAVVQRRTYPDGSTLEGTWDYVYAAPTTTVTCTAADGTLLSNQVHSFLTAQRYTDAPQSSAGLHDGTYYTLWSTGVEWRSETRNAANAVIAASEQDYSQRAAVSWPTYTQEQPANDNRVNHTRHYLDDGSYSKTDTFYDDVNYPRANNVSEVREYDFDQTLKRRSTTTYVTGSYQSDDSIHLISLPYIQTIYDPNNQVSQTTNEYDNYADDGSHLPLSYHNYGTVTGHDSNFGGGLSARGNLTAVGRWLNTNGSTIYSYTRYDILGNVVGTKDAIGNLVEFSFADDFGDGSNPGSGGIGAYGATYASPTLITSPPPQPGQPQQTARTQYDFWTGLLTGFKDRNGIVTQTIYDDPFNRPTLVKSALGIAGVENHASMYYAPTTAFGITLSKNDVLTAKDQNNIDDGVLRSWTQTDGFGRTVGAWSGDPQGNVEITTIYDALGRAKQVSNPFRPSLSENAIYTTTVYDLAGRVKTVTSPDSAVVTTEYSSNTVTVTDQMLKKRKSVTDGLGRLRQVFEDPNGSNYLTTYSYDALDSLIGVSQIDPVTSYNQTRGFAYDSLKRLTSSSNPESGTIAYQYDDNGNLKVKTDARASSHYEYDALGRVTRRWYNASNSINATTHNPPGSLGGTDEIKYFYDAQLPNNAPSFDRGYSTGQLVATTYGAGTSGDYHGYDAGGRPNLKLQQTGGINYVITASYNRAGAMTGEVYPSTNNPSINTVTYSYDAAARLNSFTGYLGDHNFRTYSTGITYSPLGSLTKEQFGTDTAIYNKLFYNSRGQLAEIRVGTYNASDNTWWNRGAIINHYSNNCWGMCGGSNSQTPMTDNNGNLRKQDVYIPGNDQISSYTMRWQEYAYDDLNRLTQVFEHTSASWYQSYAYDRWGNRTIAADTSGLPVHNYVASGVTNQLYGPGENHQNHPSIGYDAVGNQDKDYYTDNGIGKYYDRTYDGENRMKTSRTTFSDNTTQDSTYTYDGDGHRVRRNMGSVETWQVYGIGGELIAEYAANAAPSNPKKEYGYRNGQLLITAGNDATTAPPPTALGAASTSSNTNLTLSWNTASGAHKYRVERKAAGESSFGFLTTTTSSPYVDNSAQNGHTYLYKVCSANDAGACVSNYSNIVLGARFYFPTNPVICASSDAPCGDLTPVRHEHINELRDAVNAVRALAGDPLAWVGQTVNAGDTIYKNDVEDLRTKLNESLQHLGIQTSDYVDSQLAGAPNGTPIKAVHIRQLRERATGGSGSAGSGGSGASFNVHWLVADQLGTPRMIFDQSGSLTVTDQYGNYVSGMTRHDCLPFGEELFAGIGGRTSATGFGGGGAQIDRVRQRFTGYEDDSETGLNFAQSRYQSPAQGRFTSVDPSGGSIKLLYPQSFNRYSYALNNPLRYVDRDGRIPVEEVIDVLVLAYDFYQLIKDPSWTNIGFFAWDIAGTAIPYVPGSWAGRGLKWLTRAEDASRGIKLEREAVEWTAQVGKYGYKGLQAQGVVGKLENALEIAANNSYIRHGVALLAQGDKATRRLLAMDKMLKACDFVGVTKSGGYLISEAKGINTGHAIDQLQSTANYLGAKVANGSTLIAEIVVEDISKIPLGYEVKGNSLYRWDDNQLVEVTIRFQGRDVPVQVRDMSSNR